MTEPGPDCPECSQPTELRGTKRTWAAQKLIGSGVTNGSLLQVCLQAISEGDGSIPGDPKLLLPRDQDALAALARRAGFNQVHAWKLAHNWLAQQGAEVNL